MIHMIKGKMYIVGEQSGKYFFAWSTGDLCADDLPNEDINNKEHGVQWFKTYEEAYDAYLEAWKNID